MYPLWQHQRRRQTKRPLRRRPLQRKHLPRRCQLTKKSAPKKPAPKKKAAPKKVAKVSQTSTTTSTVDADVIWNVFQSDTADVSATVNGKVIYANDVKPASVKKKFLAWFKR